MRAAARPRDASVPADEDPAAEPGVAGEDVEIQIAPVSRHTVRLTVVPVKRASENGQPMNVMGDGSLVQSSWGPPLATLRGLSSRELSRQVI